jgi:putative membrane protein
MSILRRTLTAGAGVALALLAAPMIAVQAQVVAPGTNPQSPNNNPPPSANPAPTSPSKTGDEELRNDLPFLREAASANLMEVTLGRVAQSRASDTRVRDFGSRMVTDHTNLQQQLTTLTSTSGIGFTPTLDAQQQQEVSRLQRLSGSEFDREYITMMVQDHRNDVFKFEDESRNADSPRVRELAAASLPVLRQHLSLAERAARLINLEVATTPPPQPRSKVPLPTQPGQVSNPSAQTNPTAAQNADVRADRKFIHEVAADHLLEIRMAELADQKAESPAVKQFAERVVSDHERMQNDWVGMASRNGYEFKPGIGKNHKAKLNKLEKLSGQAFDRAYITTVVQDRKDYINYFEKEGRSARSSQVRQLVERDLPTLRSHFSQGKRIGGPIGADTAATLRSERLSSRN